MGRAVSDLTTMSIAAIAITVPTAAMMAGPAMAAPAAANTPSAISAPVVTALNAWVKTVESPPAAEASAVATLQIASGIVAENAAADAAAPTTPSPAAAPPASWNQFSCAWRRKSGGGVPM